MCPKEDAKAARWFCGHDEVRRSIDRERERNEGGEISKESQSLVFSLRGFGCRSFSLFWTDGLRDLTNLDD